MNGRIFRPGHLVMLTLLLIMAACSSKKTSTQKQAGLYFGAGTQSLLSKNYTEALSNLLKANELEPNNSDILNNLGMAYYFKGEKDLAIQHLKRSLEINEKNSDARTNLASIYYQDGEIALAEQLYRQVLKDLIYDKQARTYYNLGILELEKKKNQVEAEKYFQLSLKEDENFCPSHYQLGLINYGRNKFETALRNFRDATLGTCYNSPAPHYYQGLTLMKLRKFTDARLKFDEVDTKFTKSVYAVKARAKQLELNELDLKDESFGVQASKAAKNSDF